MEEQRPEWPIRCADVHIACVQTTAGNHYVVWLADGRVLDPAWGETTLADPRYAFVQYVIGVVPLPGGTP